MNSWSVHFQQEESEKQILRSRYLPLIQRLVQLRYPGCPIARPIGYNTQDK